MEYQTAVAKKLDSEHWKVTCDNDYEQETFPSMEHPEEFSGLFSATGSPSFWAVLSESDNAKAFGTTATQVDDKGDDGDDDGAGASPEVSANSP